MEKLTFLDLAERILKEEKKPLSPSEIWKIAVANGYDKQMEIKGKTPDSSLYTVIFFNTRDNPDTVFVKIGAPCSVSSEGADRCHEGYRESDHSRRRYRP